MAKYSLHRMSPAHHMTDHMQTPVDRWILWMRHKKRTKVWRVRIIVTARRFRMRPEPRLFPSFMSGQLELVSGPFRPPRLSQ